MCDMAQGFSDHPKKRVVRVKLGSGLMANKIQKLGATTPLQQFFPRTLGGQMSPNRHNRFCA